MATTETIDLFEAIEQMKAISLAGGTFSMKFRKYNRQTNAGGDLVTINAAKIRPRLTTRKSKMQVINYSLPTPKQAARSTVGSR